MTKKEIKKLQRLQKKLFPKLSKAYTSIVMSHVSFPMNNNELSTFEMPSKATMLIELFELFNKRNNLYITIIINDFIELKYSRLI